MYSLPLIPRYYEVIAMDIHIAEKNYRTALEEAAFYKNRDKAKSKYYKDRAKSYKKEFENLKRSS